MVPTKTVTGAACSAICLIHMIFSAPVLAGELSAPVLAKEGCIQRELNTKPSLIGSVAWTSSPPGIVVTDPREEHDTPGRLIVYSPEGIEQRVVPDQPKPFAGARLGGRYVEIVQKDGPEIHWIDSDFKGREKVALSGTAKDSEYRILSLYDWAILGDQMFAYGAFGRSDSAYELGFYRVSLPVPGNEKIIPIVHPVMYFGEDDFYALGNRYITTAGNTAFFLLMHVYPELWAYDLRTDDEPPRHLRGFPGENTKALAPFNTSTMRSVAEVFRDLQQREMPVGIYGQSGFVYVLTQKPKYGSLTWTLTQLRPDLTHDEVEVVGTLQIPSKASRLVVLPGPKAWYFFERHEGVDGNQRFSSLLIIPRSWIQMMELSPLQDPFKQVKCTPEAG